MTTDSYSDAISSVEEIIEDARNGRMFILVDHEDRENEGDLVIPAQMATPDAVNFMATHGRGLICLALTGDRIDALGLPLMAASNQSRHETAFTVSIEAREGVTTGISAHDRARSVAVAIDPGSGPQDIASPGHVFPLRAREGGVLVRAGHTEAAVDVARLAGLNPSGVICEVMNDDGTMARLPDLVAFAQRHGLKIGTISDLIAYRRKHDHLVRETAVEPVTSHGGAWTLRVFKDALDDAEHMALVRGDLSTGEPALVRMHVVDPLDDVLALHPDRAGQIGAAMRQIAAAGRGCIVLLRDLSPNALTDRLRPRGASPKELRQYGVGAQILLALGVSDMILLTNSPARRIVGLEGYGLSVVETRAISDPEASPMADKDGAPTPPRFNAPPRLLIVAAPFYRDIADHLLAGARAVLDGFSAPHETVEVPGALEIGAAIGFAAAGAAPRYDGFVALGCVIRGETTHYDLVCEESARAITWLGLERGLCVGNGVLTCETRAQALARADRNAMDKGGGAALAALHLIALKRRFADSP